MSEKYDTGTSRFTSALAEFVDHIDADAEGGDTDHGGHYRLYRDLRQIFQVPSCGPTSRVSSARGHSRTAMTRRKCSMTTSPNRMKGDDDAD